MEPTRNQDRLISGGNAIKERSFTMSTTNGSFKKLSLVIITLVILIASLGISAQPASAATCTQFHTVKKGEYLSLIARQYGIGWRTLADINNIKSPWVIYPGQKLCISQEGSVTPKPQPGKIPTFSIVSVDKDKSVTIKTSDFPANDRFDVLMGAMGTRGINGKKVESISSGNGGTFTANFKIPASLQGSRQIAIRLQSSTGSGFFAYNWFFNNTSGSGSPTIPTTGYKGFPTFSIVSVVRDKSVTIKTTNLPPDDSFEVFMGRMGTRGINGIKVDTTSSGNGGTLTLTYTVPDALKGSSQIAIRMQSPTSGYFAYNWFFNNSTQ
jgi:hypothetical protein